MPFSRPGSAVTTVIRELVRCHAAAGGRSSVVLSDNRGAWIDGESELFVDHRTVCPREYFTRNEMYLDHAVGAVLGRRPFTGRMALPGIDAAAAVTPDVVMVHEGHYATSTLPWWRSAFPDARIVLYVHTPISRAYSRWELARLLRCADDVVSVSNFMRRDLESRVRVRARSHAVLNGAPNIEVRAVEGLGAPTVLFVGQLAEHKGALELAQALDELARRGVPFQAVFAGSSVHGPTDGLTAYERGVREALAPHQDRVSFLGYVEPARLGTLYRSASVVCMPSMWEEPCGLVLLEAMSAGAAVVASGRGGMPEVGEDSVVYSDPGDVATFADVLETLLRDPAERRRLGERARERAAQLSWPHQYSVLMDKLALAPPV